MACLPQLSVGKEEAIGFALLCEWVVNGTGTMWKRGCLLRSACWAGVSGGSSDLRSITQGREAILVCR